MPTVEFDDKDLIDAIAQGTGYRPNTIVKKSINDKGNLVVFWR